MLVSVVICSILSCRVKLASVAMYSQSGDIQCTVYIMVAFNSIETSSCIQIIAPPTERTERMMDPAFVDGSFWPFRGCVVGRCAFGKSFCVVSYVVIMEWYRGRTCVEKRFGLRCLDFLVVVVVFALGFVLVFRENQSSFHQYTTEQKQLG